jgi:hypothetical protein
MPLSQLSWLLFRILLVPALIGTCYLHLFPQIRGCHFPQPTVASCSTQPGSQNDGGLQSAPFRLLAIGDPQLEGDTSLPDPNAPTFPSLKLLWDNVQHSGLIALHNELIPAGRAVLFSDIPTNVQAYRKRLDLWGNDHYLAHVYARAKAHTDPTHIVVLGDLLGSQWIQDDEFESRSKRFWNRVFRDGQKVPDEVMTREGGHKEVLGSNQSWKNRIINVAGNHDIGYAGDVNKERVKRFEDAFGNVNWATTFNSNASNASSSLSTESSVSPVLRVVILNSMNLDGPAHDVDLQQQSHDFLDQEIREQEKLSSETATILLTHIPLYKPEGVCVDGPFFTYWPPENGGGLKEQNHLDQDASKYILDGLAGSAGNRKTIILNGHDHEGCQTWHSRSETLLETNVTETAWVVHNSTERNISDTAHEVREITVRSIMGEFGGNVGFLSAWWDCEKQHWQFEYASCMFGVQHIWWAIHVIDIIAGSLGFLTVGLLAVETRSRARKYKIA